MPWLSSTSSTRVPAMALHRRGGSGEQELHANQRAPVRMIAHRDGSAVLVQDPLNDRKTEPGAARPACEERVEHQWQIGVVEAWSSIPHGNLHHVDVAVQLRRAPDVDDASGGGMLDGVLNQVEEHAE